MHILLSGSTPYEFTNQRDLYDQVFSGNLVFHENIFNIVSPNAKDLLFKLLKINPTERIKANAALLHPWFKQLQKNKSSLK